MEPGREIIQSSTARGLVAVNRGQDMDGVGPVAREIKLAQGRVRPDKQTRRWATPIEF